MSYKQTIAAALLVAAAAFPTIAASRPNVPTFRQGPTENEISWAIDTAEANIGHVDDCIEGNAGFEWYYNENSEVRCGER